MFLGGICDEETDIVTKCKDKKQDALNLQIHESLPGTECHLTESVEEGRGIPQMGARST